MRRRHPSQPRRHAPVAAQGFTMIELMVVVAIVAIVLVLAAPSFRELIEMRRLRGATAQLVTDLQFARSEAASRQEVVGIAFEPNPSGAGFSCYSIYALGTADVMTSSCNCSQPAASRCTPPLREIRTVRIEGSSKLQMVTVQANGTSAAPGRFGFDPATGAVKSNFPSGLTLVTPPPGGEVWIRSLLTSSGARRDLRTVVNVAGRPKVCVPTGSVVSGTAC